MKRSIITSVVLLLAFSIHAQLSRSDIRLPDFADSISWSHKKKGEITKFVSSQLTKAFIIYHNDERVYEYGNVQQPYHIFSARKSILSLLYGIYIERGIINPESTLAEIGIDDKLGLTEEEKNARIIDLLRARSGVYHKAAFETPGMEKKRPVRGTFNRDEHWYYNNWDFNALTTIFENHTKKTVFQAFDEDIAKPLEMDFDIKLQNYHREETTVHPATLWYFSANDLAQLGNVLLQNGSWKGVQIIPSKWIEESTAPYSSVGIIGGYGYCWWAAEDGFHYPFVKIPDKTYSARGTGEQNLVIIPEWDMVIVHLTEVTSPEDEMMSVTDFGKLLRIVLEQSWF